MITQKAISVRIDEDTLEKIDKWVKENTANCLYNNRNKTINRLLRMGLTLEHLNNIYKQASMLTESGHADKMLWCHQNLRKWRAALPDFLCWEPKVGVIDPQKFVL